MQKQKQAASKAQAHMSIRNALGYPVDYLDRMEKKRR